MSRKRVLVLTILCVFLFVGGSFAQKALVEGTEAYQKTIMRPGAARLEKWYRDYQDAPTVGDQRAAFSAQAALPNSFSLLDHLDYDPVRRNQIHCGNCWVWAGTGAMEISLSVKNGIKNRLSVQFLTSCKTDDFPCCGGNAVEFADWYRNVPGFALPWFESQPGDVFFDGGSMCEFGVSAYPCANLHQEQNYPLTHIAAYKVQTQGVDQSTAIYNIKRQLAESQRGVYFAFTLEHEVKWNYFRTFWNEESESDILYTAPMEPTMYYSKEDGGGGHAVLIVGYDDSDPDPNNHYWLCLNSWGTGGGSYNRPNGLFRIHMYMDYDSCFWLSIPPEDLPRYLFYVIDVGFVGSCEYALSETSSPELSAAGGYGKSFDILVTSGTEDDKVCPWTVTTTVPWVKLWGVWDEYRGSGNQSITYELEPNPNYTRRIGAIKLEPGGLYIVNQKGKVPEKPYLTATDGAYSDEVYVHIRPTDGADRYIVYRALDGPSPVYQVLTETTTTGFFDTSVEQNRVYSYCVEAANAFGVSERSIPDTGYAAFNFSPPSAPAGVNASNGTYRDKVVIVWKEVDRAEKYKVKRAVPVSPPNLPVYFQIGETPFTSFEDTTAEQGVQYLYAVVSWNYFGDSSYSASDIGYRTILLDPEIPTGVSASDGAFGDRVRVVWNGSASAASYSVHRGPKTDGITYFTKIGDTTDTVFDDTTVEAPTVYLYRVQAHNYRGASNYSIADEGFAALDVIPDPPAGISASDGKFNDRVRVQWNAVPDTVRYIVYRTPIGGWMVTPFIQIGTSETTEFDDTTAYPGVMYSYTVKSSGYLADSTFGEPDNGWVREVKAMPWLYMLLLE